MDRAVYERMAKNQAHHWWFAARREILATLISGLPRPQRILEVGCGTGANLEMLTRFGTVTGLELDDGARAHAKATCPAAHILPGALPDGLPALDEGPFDLVCMFDVLEHIEDDRAALAALARHVAPQGSLLVTVPAYQWMFGAHDRAHHHHRRYSGRRLEQVARDAGYTVTRKGHFNSLLFPLAGAQRAAAALGLARGPSDEPPPPLVNEVLRWTFALERRLLDSPLCRVGLSAWVLLRHA